MHDTISASSIIQTSTILAPVFRAGCHHDHTACGRTTAYLAIVRRVSALVVVIAVVALVVMLNQAISASDVE